MGLAICGAIALGCGFAVDRNAAGAPQDGGTPCPFGMEIPCEQTGGSNGGGGLGSTCTCGAGVWVRQLPAFHGYPEVPENELNEPVHINHSRWIVSRRAVAAPGFADVLVSGYGASHFWAAASLTKSAGARYSMVVREVWQGTGVPCPRIVSLAATGGGGLLLALSCSAAPGCGASGTASISGSCSSMGNASAFLDNKKVEGSVAYNEGSTDTEVRGSFGAEIDDSSVSIEGSISRTTEWSVRGSGNVSGSAAYSVKDDRSYCAFTNRPVTRRANGVAICAAGATVDENGSASFTARAFVDLVVN